jgi:hypothetical protein
VPGQVRRRSPDEDGGCASGRAAGATAERSRQCGSASADGGRSPAREPRGDPSPRPCRPEPPRRSPRSDNRGRRGVAQSNAVATSLSHHIVTPAPRTPPGTRHEPGSLKLAPRRHHSSVVGDRRPCGVSRAKAGGVDAVHRAVLGLQRPGPRPRRPPGRSRSRSGSAAGECCAADTATGGRHRNRSCGLIASSPPQSVRAWFHTELDRGPSSFWTPPAGSPLQKT